MVSLVNPTLPIDGIPAVKADLRANLLTIKTEIEALQAAKADLVHSHLLANISDAGALAAQDLIDNLSFILDGLITATKLADIGGLVADSYPNATVTVNGKGLVTAISAGTSSSGLNIVDDNNAAITIDASLNGTCRRLINDAGHTLTLANDAPVNTRVGWYKASAAVPLVQVEADAGYHFFGTDASDAPLTSNFNTTGYMEAVVDANSDGVHAVWRIGGNDNIQDALAANLDVADFTLLNVGIASQLPAIIPITCSDFSTSIAAGTTKGLLFMPFAMDPVLEVIGFAGTAPTGANIVMDVNEGAGLGTSILGDKITIEAGEFTSLDAAAPPTITDTALAKGARITVDFDSVGSTEAGKQVGVYLIGIKA